MNNNKIAIIGQGYVGLPLAIEFGKKFNTIGFDIDKNRISELKKSIDKTNEATSEMINESKFLKFSNSVDDIRNAMCILSQYQLQLIHIKHQT